MTRHLTVADIESIMTDLFDQEERPFVVHLPGEDRVRLVWAADDKQARHRAIAQRDTLGPPLPGLSYFLSLDNDQ